MSRCFPFPSSEISRKDALQVGSIKKLHKECGNAKHGREKKREKKENRKRNVDKQEKSKKRSRQQDELDYSVHMKKKCRYEQESELFESLRDWKKDASDQWERSGLTEEHELPSSIPNPCSSMESTQNSGRKSKLLVADMKRKDQGLVLRIKLPLMKHKLSVIAGNTNTEPCCSYEAVAVTNVIRPSSAEEEASCFKEKTLVKQQDLRSTPANEDPCFSGRATETLMPEGLAATDFISSSCGGSLELGKCFNDLILNWNPSSLQSYDLNLGSQDWLFVPPRWSPHRNLTTSCKAASKPDHKVGLISTSSSQPQACYLPDFDIYQLPYVIPF
ncbi:hypothetical protein IEQ34_015149 [Dendrobium chrysotoxum]|uniref:Uncharacterized protein n=1 Tax=Dendrobium chrysotoxum TaxID=161865 RepID=A0AAV7GLU9_DENCH|nr:hypothetical protein IEQ34_015149 [Dendrobium chrysotoxum]